MKGVCADGAQEIDLVDIFCAYIGMRWDGILHGFHATDQRYASSRLEHHWFPFLTDIYFCVAVTLLDIPLPAFHICAMDAPLWTEWAYVSGVAICGAYSPLSTGSQRLICAPEQLDFATFICIILFVKKLKADLGQAHTLSHLMKTLIQDSTIYFFIMLTFNVAMLVYGVMARASLKNFPLV